MKELIRVILLFILLGALLFGCKPIEKTVTFHSDMFGKSDPRVICTSKRRINKIQKKVDKCNLIPVHFDCYIYITKEMIKCDSTLLNKKELNQIKN